MLFDGLAIIAVAVIVAAAVVIIAVPVGQHSFDVLLQGYGLAIIAVVVAAAVAPGALLRVRASVRIPFHFLVLCVYVCMYVCACGWAY